MDEGEGGNRKMVIVFVCYKDSLKILMINIVLRMIIKCFIIMVVFIYRGVILVFRLKRESEIFS